jgi:dephospho-CoA kinase
LRERQLTEAKRRGDAVVISDIPLLFEVGLEHAFDGVILVDAPESARLERLVRDRALSRDQAQAMMNAQWPSTRKRAGATWIIDNDGPPEQLAGCVADLWQTILALPLRGASADTTV